ncbi:site-specific integrase [Kitasatospora cineracea]|uniref:site-specific integrase n=1 Tax=Kitasatospora cineracea TaxID=88074 RepID=UPI0036D7F008
MDLYFVKRSLAERYSDVLPAGPYGAVSLLDRRAIPDGTPVFLDRDMRPVEPVSSWFRHLAYQDRDPATMRSYAYVVSRLVDFLQERGTDLLSAGEADLVAYRRQRVAVQTLPVGESTWDREASTINGLYDWLTERGYVPRRPLRLSRRFGSGMVRQLQVRHLSLEQYLYFRDVGLGGQRPDGEVSAGFRGWCPHRGRAAAELALLTGMRKREWASVLLPELGVGVRRGAEPARFRLEACAKYGRPRDVYIPSAALDLVDTYLLLERTEIAERAALGLARRRRELFVVDRVDEETGKLSGVLEGRRRTFAIARMPAGLRAVTVRESERGLESLAVFLGQGGLMLGPSSWDRVRRDAWRRMLAYSADPRTPVLPRRPWRFHDLRHTLALQLLRHLTRAAVAAEVRRADPRSMVSLGEHIAVNPLLIVQRVLGHASPRTTYAYLSYLDDPMNYVEEALRAWTDSDGATYAEIARHLLEGDRDAQEG